MREQEVPLRRAVRSTPAYLSRRALREHALDLLGIKPQRRRCGARVHKTVAHEPTERLGPPLGFALDPSLGPAHLDPLAPSHGADLLDHPAHRPSPLLCVPEPALLPGRGREARLVVRLCLLERPHERGDVAAVPRQGTHVDLAKAAPGDPADLPHDPVHMIRRAGGSEGVELADERYADVRDVPEAPSGDVLSAVTREAQWRVRPWWSPYPERRASTLASPPPGSSQGASSTAERLRRLVTATCGVLPSRDSRKI